MIIWITGLSGAGKTTLAKALYNDVKKKFPNTLWIDGDIIRKHYQNTKFVGFQLIFHDTFL